MITRSDVATPDLQSATHLQASSDLQSAFRFWPRHNEAIYERLESKHSWLEERRRSTEAKTTEDPLEHELILNIGPQHPATHGVLRCVVRMDGETIEKSVLDIGYLHRGIEKLAEHKTYQEFMPYTDRMDYLAPYSNNVAWCLAVEKLAAIEVPERAQWIRMIMCELARISSHLLWLGVGLMDAGAVSMFLWTFKGREDLYRIFDEITGARFTVSHSRIGGLASDLTPEAFALIHRFVDEFGSDIEGWEGFLNRNRLWIDRNENVGPLTREEAIDLGLTGPNLRASGEPHDIRRFEPYLNYEDVDFGIPIREEGDSLARYFVRMEEMKESLRIIRQCLERLPAIGALWLLSFVFGSTHPTVPVQLPTHVLLALAAAVGASSLVAWADRERRARVALGLGCLTLFAVVPMGLLWWVAKPLSSSIQQLPSALPVFCAGLIGICAAAAMLLVWRRQGRSAVLLMISSLVLVNMVLVFFLLKNDTREAVEFRDSVRQVGRVAESDYLMVGTWGRGILFNHYLYGESYSDRWLALEWLQGYWGEVGRRQATASWQQALSDGREIWLLGHYGDLVPELRRHGYGLESVHGVFRAAPAAGPPVGSSPNRSTERESSFEQAAADDDARP